MLKFIKFFKNLFINFENLTKKLRKTSYFTLWDDLMFGNRPLKTHRELEGNIIKQSKLMRIIIIENTRCI
jgi:hypothetical protein